MSAPAPSSRPPGWYRSGARARPVTIEQSREMADSAWIITSRLIAGPVLYAGLGWLVSRWVGHQALLMATGAMLGLVLAYVLVFTSLSRDGRSRRG